jgi:hypothetical protein
MAREGRLAFPGAVYHLINRGNYRRDLFEEDETRAAFEDRLFAACTRSSWLLHAFRFDEAALANSSSLGCSMSRAIRWHRPGICRPRPPASQAAMWLNPESAPVRWTATAAR